MAGDLFAPHETHGHGWLAHMNQEWCQFHRKPDGYLLTSGREFLACDDKDPETFKFPDPILTLE
jgi:hypothetical protein